MSKSLTLVKGDKVKVLFSAGIYTRGVVDSYTEFSQLVIRDDSGDLLIVGNFLYIEVIHA